MLLCLARIRVTVDGEFLHYILPFQFLDSPEWDSLRPTEEGIFQVRTQQAAWLTPQSPAQMNLSPEAASIPTEQHTVRLQFIFDVGMRFVSCTLPSSESWGLTLQSQRERDRCGRKESVNPLWTSCVEPPIWGVDME